MASLAYIEREINSLPAEQRATFLRIFQSFMRDLRFGHPAGEQPDPCENFGAGFFSVVTATTPGHEFTIPHGFGRVPYLAMPVIPLDTVGASIVPLTVSRVADDKRLYFTSTLGDVPITLYVEG